MTTGTIIVFLWAINFFGLLIANNAGGQAESASPIGYFIVALIFTILQFGAIKLIDYLVSKF